MALLAPLCAGRIGAQQAGQDQAGKEQAASPTAAAPPPLSSRATHFKDSFPIPAGEKLEYDVKLSLPPRPASLGVLSGIGRGSRPSNTGAAGDQQKAPAL